MHIPDGYLTLLICVVFWIISALFLVVAFWRANKTLSEKQIPLMATLTAMIFAAQMVNYPIIGGTTAHLLGGPILAITLGPFTGLISMTIILTIQTLFFRDGGLLTFGANLFNMGIIGTFIPYVIFIGFLKIKPSKNSLIAGGFIGAFLGDLFAALAAALELGLSVPVFPYDLGVALVVMAIHHSIIGVIEGIATVIILLTILRVRPDLLKGTILEMEGFDFGE
jgi:cobalt/nickel transport system permease protein